MRPQILERRIVKRIAHKHGDVFLRADFGDLGGYDQVGRALRLLVNKGMLLKISHGLYARAKASPSDGTPTLVKPLHAITLEALDRLGIKIVPTQIENAHGTRESTQTTSERIIGVTMRVRRKIEYDGTLVRLVRDRQPLDEHLVWLHETDE